MVTDKSTPILPLDLTGGERLLFERSPAATLIYDAAGLILAANPAATSLYGYGADEFAALNLERIVRNVSAHVRKDGSEIPVETEVHPILWRGSAAQILFVTDKTAVAAVKSEADFLSTMSQEIRTPLNGVLAMAAMLAETDLTEEQKNFLSTIRSSSEMLFSRLNDVVDYAKTEERTLTLDAVDFDLRSAIEEVMDIAGGMGGQKKIDLTSEVAADVISEVKGDPGRLKQILLNLLSNSIKFTDSGSVALTVGKLDGSDMLRFEVADTGVGISKKDLKKLFRRESKNGSSAGGTGLGLTISKRLIELMGGEMGVSSLPGKGSTFWFTARFTLTPAKAEDQNSASLTGREVLLVQSSPEDRSITRGLLEAMGVTVTEASNAAQALSLCTRPEPANQRFSLCAVDFNLPLIDGVKLARLLREQQAQSNPENKRAMKFVLFLSGCSPQQLLDAKEAGADDILVKPLRYKQLQRSLSHCLSAGAPAPNVNKAEETASEGTNKHSASILVVEDNLVNQMVASLCLQKLGYAVQVAEDGLAALDAFTRTQFDLILMDCHMPRMDGATATQKIREMGGSGQSIPILALTADVFQTERDRCMASGMNDFLSKPVRIDILKSKLEYWLNRPEKE